MKKILSRKFALIIIIIANFFLTGCFKSSSNKSRIISKLTLIDSVTLNSPLLRFQISNNEFYAYDFYDKSLVKLDKNYNVSSKMGSWGEGPKENLLIRNFKVLKEERIAIFDVEKNTFKIQDFNDSVHIYKKFDYSLMNGVLFDRKIIASKLSKKNILEFDILDLETFESNPIESINQLLNFDYSGLIYEGKLLQNKEKIFFTSYFSSFWFIYDLQSKKLTSGSYLHKFKKPNVFDNGAIMMLENATELIYDSFICDNYIYVISNVGEKGYSDERFLDIYAIENFDYIKSYTLPILNGTSPDEGFFIKEKRLGILYEDKIYFCEL